MKIQKLLFEAEVVSESSGILEEIDSFQLANFAIHLGAGRKRKEDKIDHKVGFSRIAKVGDIVEKGQTLCRIHSGKKEDIANMQNQIIKLFKITDSKKSTSSFRSKLIYSESFN